MLRGYNYFIHASYYEENNKLKPQVYYHSNQQYILKDVDTLKFGKEKRTLFKNSCVKKCRSTYSVKSIGKIL